MVPIVLINKQQSPTLCPLSNPGLQVGDTFKSLSQKLILRAMNEEREAFHGLWKPHPSPCPTLVSCTRLSRGLEVGHCHEERDQGGQSWKEKIGSIIDQSNLPGLSVSSLVANSKASPHPQLSDPPVSLATQKARRKGAACLMFACAEIRTHTSSPPCREENRRELQRVFLSSPPLPLLQFFFLPLAKSKKRVHPTGLLTLREVLDI